MAVIDLFFGGMLGLVQGLLFAPIYNLSARYFLRLASTLLKRIRTTIISIVLPHIVAVLAVGLFLVVPLTLERYIADWNAFKFSWIVGFGIAALAYSLLGQVRVK